MEKSTVKDIQKKLNSVLGINLIVDGGYGRKSKNAVRKFQRKYDLHVDGVVGVKTLNKLNFLYERGYSKDSELLNFNKSRFVVFVDAGHGGIDDNGKYTTSGKRAYHKNSNLHDGGNYYEGHENRIVAESFIEECSKLGIMCIRTYHPYKDTSLKERVELIRGYLNRGYYGYLHSFHTNAISSKNSPSTLENTVGFCVYTTLGNTLSDKISQTHFNNVTNIVGKGNWKFRTQSVDGDSDYEADFYILRKTDNAHSPNFGAILDEWGFHTSKKDCEFIVDQKNRDKHVSASIKTAIWTKNLMENL